MFMPSSAIVFSLLAANAYALVARSKVTGCDPSGAKMTLPEDQIALVQPEASPTYLLLGVGTQNYTCSAAGTYTYVKISNTNKRYF